MPDMISQKVADKQGNYLKIMASGNVFLKLLSEKHDRKIGFIDRSNATLVVERERGIHLHRKTNSYGFNHHLLVKAKTFDKILLKDDYGQYVVPVKLILEHGKMHFKEQGFELQVFLAIEIMDNCRVHDKNTEF